MTAYLNEHFVSSYQKVGTFRLVNGQKQGGNVAAYFCEPDGNVLHALLGPVDAATFLREARWIVETAKMADLPTRANTARYRQLVAQAHRERLLHEHHFDPRQRRMPSIATPEAFLKRAFERHDLPMPGSRQGRIHLLLALYPLADIDQIYQGVFEKILGEKVSTLPVVQR